MEYHQPSVGRANPPVDATPPPRIPPPRPNVTVRLCGGPPGVAPTHPYVRHWWTCVLGPTAVIDLLRMARAARDHAPLPVPVGLPRLIGAGLAHRHHDIVILPERIPPVTAPFTDRIPVPLRDSHRRAVAALVLSEPSRLSCRDASDDE